MTWREELTGIATFRGVPFLTTDASIGVGRRNVLNEYPLRDEPYTDDLGRRARKFDVEGHVIGDDYLQQRDALIEAFEEAGPGELVHPRYGVRWVSLREEVRFKESPREGGIARFTAVFVEDSDNRQPAATDDTVGDVEEAAEALDDAAQDAFTSALDLAGPQVLTDLVAGGLSANLGSVMSAASLCTSVGGLGSMIAAAKSAGLGAISSLVSGVGLGGLAGLAGMATQGLSALTGQISSLLGASPLGLVLALRDTYSGLAVYLRTDDGPTSSSSSAPAAALSALRTASVQDRASIPAVSSPGQAQSSSALVTTESRAEKNETARADLNRRLLISTQARVLAVATTDALVATATQATVWRDQLLEQVDAELELADPDVRTVKALTQLRAAVVRDVAARAELLAQRSTFTPLAVLPSLVLAHRIYVDARRADELVQRNGVPNPAFVPAATLEILL